MKFTLEQITEAQRKSTNFPLFIQNLRILGVADFVTSVSDGYTDYFDMDKESINSEPTHDFLVAEKADSEKFLGCFSRSQRDRATWAWADDGRREPPAARQPPFPASFSRMRLIRIRSAPGVESNISASDS